MGFCKALFALQPPTPLGGSAPLPVCSAPRNATPLWGRGQNDRET